MLFALFQSICEYHQVRSLRNRSSSGHVTKSVKLIGWLASIIHSAMENRTHPLKKKGMRLSTNENTETFM